MTSQFQEIGALISEVLRSCDAANRLEAIQILRQLATFNSSIVNNDVFHDFVKIVYLYVISGALLSAHHYHFSSRIAPLHDVSNDVRIEAVYLTM